MATRLDLADAQFIGYSHRRDGYSLISLVESMGLTKKEWNKWKRVYTQLLKEDDVEEINAHFKKNNQMKKEALKIVSTYLNKEDIGEIAKCINSSRKNKRDVVYEILKGNLASYPSKYLVCIYNRLKSKNLVPEIMGLQIDNLPDIIKVETGRGKNSLKNEL